MKFSDIIGYDSLKKQLIQSVVSDQIAHAQLFLGPEGGPNLAMALAFTSFINCKNRTENDSCGECDACIKNSKLVHPDVHFAFPVSSTKKIPAKDAISVKFLSEWRNFVIQDPYSNASGWNNYFGGENKQLNISRQESREDGNTYPLIKIEVSSVSHPFYTGKKIFVDTAGRVEKFNRRYKKT